MLNRRILCVAVAALFLSVILVQQAEAGKVKKILLAKLIADTLKPRFIPIPLPIPFKLKINKGDRVVYDPVYSQSYSHEMSYGGGGYGGGEMGGFGGMGGGYGGGY